MRYKLMKEFNKTIYCPDLPINDDIRNNDFKRCKSRSHPAKLHKTLKLDHFSP